MLDADKIIDKYNNFKIYLRLYEDLNECPEE